MGRVLDDPRKLQSLVSKSCITSKVEFEVIEVKVPQVEVGQDEIAAGLAMYLYGRPNGVAEGHYEKLHVLGIDVAARLAAALCVVGTNTWGGRFSKPVDVMMADPDTLPITESGLTVVTGAGAVAEVSRLRRRRR